MRRLALALIATCGLTASASAADMAAKPVYKAAPMVAAYNWTGFYLGAVGGGAWGRSQHINSAGDLTDRFNISGAMFGGTVGYNFQSAQWVWGLEGDFSWSGKKGSASDIPPFNTAFTSETREKWFATARGRLGYAGYDRWLFYVTGGYAAAGTDITVTGPALQASESKTRSGWTVGAGFETALWGNWTAKVEYLYADFGNKAYFNPAPAGFADRAGGVRLNDHVARAGLNYRF